MRPLRPLELLVSALIALAVPEGVACAQGTDIAFGASRHDASLPVEITADSLELDQGAATAVFIGEVRVGQGALRLAADRVEVFYDEGADGGQGAVERLEALGNVTLANGEQAAESETARYDVASGIVEMSGDVILTQGQNALSGQSLRIDLGAGTGTFEGRVRTIFAPGAAQ
jgi:lipopolysaccharide export system protein LptA